MTFYFSLVSIGDIVSFADFLILIFSFLGPEVEIFSSSRVIFVGFGIPLLLGVVGLGMPPLLGEAEGGNFIALILPRFTFKVSIYSSFKPDYGRVADPWRVADPRRAAEPTFLIFSFLVGVATTFYSSCSLFIYSSFSLIFC